MGSQTARPHRGRLVGEGGPGDLPFPPVDPAVFHGRCFENEPGDFLAGDVGWLFRISAQVRLERRSICFQGAAPGEHLIAVGGRDEKPVVSRRIEGHDQAILPGFTEDGHPAPKTALSESRRRALASVHREWASLEARTHRRGRYGAPGGMSQTDPGRQALIAVRGLWHPMVGVGACA